MRLITDEISYEIIINYGNKQCLNETGNPVENSLLWINGENKLLLLLLLTLAHSAL
jgi:hypothetical protein